MRRTLALYLLFAFLLLLSTLSFLIRGDDNYYLRISADFDANFSADFDYKNKRWLVVYEKNGKIWGAFVELNKKIANPPGEFEIDKLNCSSSAKCYDPYVRFGCYNATCRFLITYVQHHGDYNAHIYYNLLDENGKAIFNDPIKLSSLPATYPVAEFDHINGRFLVVFTEYSPATTLDIKGFLVGFSESSTVIGDKIVISNAFREQLKPHVTFSDGLSYLVVWQDHRGDPEGDIYYQFIGVDGSRIGENTGVGIFPGKPEITPYVFWLPSIQKFIVAYRTTSLITATKSTENCPIISRRTPFGEIPKVLCEPYGHYVYSIVEKTGIVNFPGTIAIAGNSPSLPTNVRHVGTEHYGRMGTDYIVFAGDSQPSMSSRRHFRIFRFTSTPPKDVKSNPTFWFPDKYDVKVGLEPSAEYFCSPVRHSEEDAAISVVPRLFTLEERKAKTEIPALFPRFLDNDKSNKAKTFISATTYPSINTALVIFGDWKEDDVKLITVDTNPVVFDYEYLRDTTLPVAVTNTCYYTYGAPPCEEGYQIRVTGGKGPYTFWAVEGQMPPGLTLESNGILKGFIEPVPIDSICKPYPCPFTFSVLVSDSSEPRKYSCMTFEILLYPSPEVVLDYHPSNNISICTKIGESKREYISIRNAGTPVTVQIFEPAMISFGEASTCSSVINWICAPGNTSIAPFHLEIHTRHTTVDDGCLFLPLCQICDCRKFKYELKTDESIWGMISLFSTTYGEYSTRITFHVTDSVFGYSGTHTISVKGFVLAQDIYVSGHKVSPESCPRYGEVCQSYILSLGTINVEDTLDVSLYIGNAVTSAAELGCPDGIYLNVMTIYAPVGNPNFRILHPTPSEFGTIWNISIPGGLTQEVVVRVTGTLAGPMTYPIVIYSDDPDSKEKRVQVTLTAYFQAATLSVSSITDCGLALRSVPTKCYVKIENSSPVSAVVRDIQVVGSEAFYPLVNTPFSIGPFSTYLLEVSFYSPTTGHHFSILALYSKSVTPVITFGLMGQVADQDEVLMIEPPSLDFGRVLTGASIRGGIKFINMTSYSLYVTPLVVDPPFEFPSAASFEIQRLSDRGFSIDFHPRSEGLFSSLALFRVSSDRFSFNLTYSVSGTGISPESAGLVASARIVPGYIDFGNVVLCSPTRCPVSVKPVNIINNGNVPVELVSLSYPPNISNYSVSLPLRITDFHPVDFVAHTRTLGQVTGSITFGFSSTAGAFTRNVTFYLNGVSPGIFVFPSSVSFPTVRVGDEQIYPIFVTNTGNWKLTVTHISLDPPFFSDTPFPFEVLEGETKKIYISFKPKAVSTYTGRAVIFSDAPYSESVVVSLMGTSSENPLPVADIHPTSFDFGKVRMGTTKSERLEIRNIGSSDLFVSSISSFAQDFSVKLDQPIPFIISRGGSVTATVTFSPLSESLVESYILIRTNDANNPAARVSVKGEGANPHIKVPSELNFGGVRRGKTVKKEFPIENTGNLPLQAEISVEGDKEFVFISEYAGEITGKIFLVIPEKSSSKIDVYFTPSGLEKYKATVSIKSDDPDRPFIDVPVVGEGGFPALMIETREIDFGEIYIDEKEEYDLKVSNVGNAPLEVTFYVADTVFRLSLTTFVVPPQESYVLKIVFSPEGRAGRFISTLSVVTDDPKNRELTLTLKGTAKGFGLIPIGSGCSCSSFSQFSYDSIVLFVALVLFFIVRRGSSGFGRSAGLFFSVTTLLFVFASSTLSQSIGVNINNFYPYQDISDFSFVRTGFIRTRRTLGWGGFFSFAKDPLMLKVTKEQSVVSKQTLVSSSIYSGFLLSYVPSDRVELCSFFPFSIIRGRSSEFSLSDVFLEMKYVLFSEKELSVSLNPQLGVPTFGSEFVSDRTISPRLGLVISRESGFGIFRLNTSANLGFEYEPEKRVGDIELGSRLYLMLGGALRYRNIASLSAELLSFASLEDLRRETTPVELVFSIGTELPDVKTRIGVSSGLTEGIGSPRYRFFFLFNYDVPPPVPPVRYSRVEGRVLDHTGQAVPKGIVFVQELGISSSVVDGAFEMELPDGQWSFKFTSAGYETKVQKFSIPTERPEITVKKLEPQLIIAPTDRFGISQSVEMIIKTHEGVIKTSTDLVALSTYGTVEIQTKDVTKTLFISPGEISWINLVSVPTPEEKTEKVQTKVEDRVRGKDKRKQQEFAKRKEKLEKIAEQKHQLREVSRKEGIVEESKQDESKESRLDAIDTDKKFAEKKVDVPERNQLVTDEGKVKETVEMERTLTTPGALATPGVLATPGDKTERRETPEFTPKASGALPEKGAPGKTEEKVVLKQTVSKERLSEAKGEPGERGRELIVEREEAGEGRQKEVSAEVSHLMRREETKTREDEKLPPITFEEKRKLESELTTLISKVLDGFVVDSWSIPKYAHDELNKIADMIIRNKDRISSIRIEGHTDITGPEDWNVELSYLRANEIRKYLYRRGVKTPIEIIGYYYLKPVAPNDSEENRRKNRRVEVIVFTED